MTSAFGSFIDYVSQNIDTKSVENNQLYQKDKRPLKMPKDYDFSVRNVDWRQYKDDYLLRTDAIWERTKLLDMFYTLYKSKFVYDNFSNRYMISNIRQMPLPTNEPEHFEDWRQFHGYTDVDGCIW